MRQLFGSARSVRGSDEQMPRSEVSRSPLLKILAAWSAFLFWRRAFWFRQTEFKSASRCAFGKGALTMKAYLIRYLNRQGKVEEYGLPASCVQQCKDWVRAIGCTFLSAREVA